MEVYTERVYVTEAPQKKVSRSDLLNTLLETAPDNEHVRNAKIALNLRVIPDDPDLQAPIWLNLWGQSVHQ